MKKVLLISIVSIVVILYLIGRNDQKERTKMSIYWSSPTSEQIGEISTILSANNITGCGDYRVCDLGRGEIKIACSSDGTTWTFYDIWTGIEKVNITPIEESNNFPIPN